jgi:hypothetical protein
MVSPYINIAENLHVKMKINRLTAAFEKLKSPFCSYFIEIFSNYTRYTLRKKLDAIFGENEEG